MTSHAMKSKQLAIAVGSGSQRHGLKNNEAYHSTMPESNHCINRAGGSQPVWNDRPTAYKIVVFATRMEPKR